MRDRRMSDGRTCGRRTCGRRTCDRFSGSDRAVSVTVGYVLSLAIAGVLLGGIAIGIGGVLDAQTERAVHGDIAVVGEGTVANLESADRLARAAEAGRADPDLRDDPDFAASDPAIGVTVEFDLPTRVAGSAYTIDVYNETIVLQTERPEATLRVPHLTRTDVAEGSVRGGPLRVDYVPDDSDPAAGSLEVSER